MLWAAIPLAIIVAATSAYYTVQRLDPRLFGGYARYEAALRYSPQFKEPLMVDAYKERSALSTPFNSTQQANVVAKTLEIVGLISITETTRDITATPSRFFTDPYGRNISPSAMRLGKATVVELKLTARGEQDAGAWQTISDKSGREGWHVPVGTREMIEIVTVRAEEDASVPGERRASVGFKWIWKPNELGKYFDKGTGDYRLIAQSLGPRVAFSVGDSRDTNYGVAQMHSSRGVWIVDSITWNSPSPKNEADMKKIDDILERASRPGQ